MNDGSGPLETGRLESRSLKKFINHNQMQNIDPFDPECTIENTRTVSASTQLAFRAWSEPHHLKVWWGPAGFTNTFHTFDFRPGGRWCFVMHGPDKGNYVNEVEFVRIEPPSLIYWKRHSKPLFRVLVTFEEVDAEHTRIVFRQIFDTVEECDKLRRFVVDKNEENFDRLEEVLKGLLRAEKRFGD